MFVYRVKKSATRVLLIAALGVAIVTATLLGQNLLFARAGHTIPIVQLGTESQLYRDLFPNGVKGQVQASAGHFFCRNMTKCKRPRATLADQIIP